MEKSWKIVFLGLLSAELCNGLPINSENTIADSHTQLLTGLVAVLLTVCSVVFLLGCLCCQRSNGFKEFRDSPVVASSSNLDHGHVNPVANGEFTIFTPLSPPHQNNNIFLANQQVITRTKEDYVFGEVDVSSWFNSTETDFPRTKLKYIKEIGKGWFGRVVEGAASLEPGEKWTPVIVRILEATATSQERVVFLHDASIYRCGHHSNILGLLGRSLETVPLLLLQEFCPQGDLKKYLRENQPTADRLLSSEYPLIWCCQLSSALKHLHDHRVIHQDLSARNCQLSSNLTLKLGDYGLAVFQYPEDYYQGAPAVPVRWCAPELLEFTSTTIQPKKVTKEGNIWSFGVTIWEICECGAQPFSQLSDDEVVSMVFGAQKVRLDRPKYRVLYTDYIYRLMQLCWTTSESRPAMSQIDLMLSDLLQVYKNTKSTEIESLETIHDFDKRWEKFKPNSIIKTDNFIDNLEIDIDNSEISASKPLSPSLNNLHGSLDNLVDETQMESWLENVASDTGDMSYVKGLSDAIKDLDNAIGLEKIEFQLGPQVIESSSDFDSLVSTQRVSSGSETEEENWKTKIERGAYTEKVRQKSRSVADLMVLTHIDPSESDSETPMPSLDARNVRFGSEGNLLNVQDTFENELKKLQEERRDSLLFVPENHSHSENLVSDETVIRMLDAPRLLQELNSTTEIKPSQQVFNVFNVTIDPIRTAKLEEIIKLGEQPLKTSDDENEDSGVDDKMESTESLRNLEEKTELYQVPTLVDLIQENDALMDYIIAKYETETEKVSFDVSDNQDETMPPLKKDLYDMKETDLYSLETWDNFLGEALDQNESQELFDSFSEPPSMLFSEESQFDKTYTLDDGKEKSDEEETSANWEDKGSGWFLHPQTEEVVNTESYVGFNVDDEIMTAIRNELLHKLPQAQGASNGGIQDEEEWESAERNEVFLRYNVYNTPLSPIPEESFSDVTSYNNTPNNEESEDEWSDRCERENLPQTIESPQLEPLHRHTPSQDSCCSNDTLFNLEELACVEKEETPLKQTESELITPMSNEIVVIDETSEATMQDEKAESDNSTKTIINDFLTNERSHSEESSDFLLAFKSQAAPLPSPEDKPWKQLPASLLSYDTMSQSNTLTQEQQHDAEADYVNIPQENLDLNDFFNEADYVNLVNIENTKNSEQVVIDQDQDIFGVLTDIRFSGPGDQMMTTSFSESNDLNDEHDWDSGSDTRSSSSGEFIWKEGEHEESLKALRAAPQDVLEDIPAAEEIREDTCSESSDDDDDDDEESPEFVPSAWDKYATPTKSALRSPEKTLERSDNKKPKGVWFKKQKYHCIYEYPREPESPVLNSYDLWKAGANYEDWELEGTEPENTDDVDFPSYFPKPSRSLNVYQLSSLGDFATRDSVEDEFYVSGTAKPFDLDGCLSSQFFPGAWSESATPDSGMEDLTPGSSGAISPIFHPKSLKELAAIVLKGGKPEKRDVLGGLRHTRDKLKLDLPPSPSAFTSSKMFNIEPSIDPVTSREKPAFTTFGKSRFLVQHVETPEDNIQVKNVSFEALPYKPLQTQILKENFDDETSRGKVESVRGEASLLDSGDEDSGIESSTLERRLTNQS